ncbi:porin [Pseudaeromonas paramecii]|uniref:Porin n=1 Tax=Pseudaeromonas paramecii TaxID=2138166 RepID=A0ABP8PUT3_9GAMM
MKKTILAVVIPALFAVSANAAVVYDKDGTQAEVYGRAQFDVADDGEDTNGVGSARLGVKGKVAIADGVSGIARGEWQVAAENSDSSKFKARHVYAGFDYADYGTLVFGQTDTAFYQAVAATDIFNTYGYETANIIESGRQEGQVVYAGQFGGFYVGASYEFRDPNYTYTVGGADGTEDIATGASLDNGYAATLGYSFDFGLSVYGGFNKEDVLNGNDKKNYAVSATYSLDSLYLGALYAEAKMGDAKLKGYDFVASYGVTDAVTLYTGYATQELSGTASSDGDTADALKLGAQYKFTSNFMTWGEYLVDGIDGHDDQWTVALQYNF